MTPSSASEYEDLWIAASDRAHKMASNAACYIRDAVNIDSPMSVTSLPPSPVTPKNRDSWTEEERKHASQGVRVGSIAMLQNKVSQPAVTVWFHT